MTKTVGRAPSFTRGLRTHPTISTSSASLCTAKAQHLVLLTSISSKDAAYPETRRTYVSRKEGQGDRGIALFFALLASWREVLLGCGRRPRWHLRVSVVRRREIAAQPALSEAEWARNAMPTSAHQRFHRRDILRVRWRPQRLGGGRANDDSPLRLANDFRAAGSAQKKSRLPCRLSGQALWRLLVTCCACPLPCVTQAPRCFALVTGLCRFDVRSIRPAAFTSPRCSSRPCHSRPAERRSPRWPGNMPAQHHPRCTLSERRQQRPSCKPAQRPRRRPGCKRIGPFRRTRCRRLPPHRRYTPYPRRIRRSLCSIRRCPRGDDRCICRWRKPSRTGSSDLRSRLPGRFRPPGLRRPVRREEDLLIRSVS